MKFEKFPVSAIGLSVGRPPTVTLNSRPRNKELLQEVCTTEWSTWKEQTMSLRYPDSKVHGANMGPTWGRQDPGGPHVGHVNLAIWVCTLFCCGPFGWGYGFSFRWILRIQFSIYSRASFSKKTPYYWYRDSHYKAETVVRPSQAYNRIPVPVRRRVSRE